MCNVNQPWKFGDGCVCQAVRERLAERGGARSLVQTDTIDGHFFVTGRDYHKEKEVFVSAMHKLREFASLGYPVSVRKGACYRVARDGGGLAWLAAAKAQGA